MSGVEQSAVTQADREAAASAYYAWIGPNPTIPQKITSGRADGHTMVQAFARHRIASMPVTQSDEFDAADVWERANSAAISAAEHAPDGLCTSAGEAAAVAVIAKAFAATQTDQDKLISDLVAVLEWYREQAKLARLIHSEGDEGRNNLAADGGERARTIIDRAQTGGAA